MSDDTNPQLGDQPIQKEYRAFMNRLAQKIDELFNGNTTPRKTGFVLMVFAFGPDDGTHRTNYISNADRADVVKMLREQLAHFEGRMQEEGHG